jgi:HEAT repeat protein
MFTSPSVTDRYTAAKALSNFENSSISEVLKERINDPREHIYVRLESAAGLTRLKQSSGLEFIAQTLHGEYLEHRLEGIIILGEIHLPESQEILISALLNKEQHPEIRAGAAWALGELKQPKSIDALIQSFMELSKPIRIEAARALRKISEIASVDVLSKLPPSEDNQKAGIAWAVSKSGQIEINDLIRVMVDNDARKWAAYILGTQNPEQYINKIEILRNHDPEVYFAVTVLWKVINSWVYNLEEY